MGAAVFQLAVGLIAWSSRPVLAVLHEGGAIAGETDAVWVHRLVGAMALAGQTVSRALARGARLLAPLARFAPLARWEDRGRAEEREGERLARIAVARLRNAVFDQLARSAELKQLVHTQSQSLTQSAIEQVRSVGTRADDRAERMVRRLFRRTR